MTVNTYHASAYPKRTSVPGDLHPGVISPHHRISTRVIWFGLYLYRNCQKLLGRILPSSRRRPAGLPGAAPGRGWVACTLGRPDARCEWPAGSKPGCLGIGKRRVSERENTSECKQTVLLCIQSDYTSSGIQGHVIWSFTHVLSFLLQQHKALAVVAQSRITSTGLLFYDFWKSELSLADDKDRMIMSCIFSANTKRFMCIEA